MDIELQAAVIYYKEQIVQVQESLILDPGNVDLREILKQLEEGLYTTAAALVEIQKEHLESKPSDLGVTNGNPNSATTTTTKTIMLPGIRKNEWKKGKQKKTMHGLNIYCNKPPDFLQLANDEPILKPFVTDVSAGGRVRFPYTSWEATRALTAALLSRDFGVQWSLPHGYLIPPVPNRLNYILWISDLLYLSGLDPSSGSEIHGLDIGCGANLIYCLLGAAAYGWRMTGLDIDQAAITWASTVVQKNPHLASLIRIVDGCTGEEVVEKRRRQEDQEQGVEEAWRKEGGVEGESESSLKGRSKRKREDEGEDAAESFLDLNGGLLKKSRVQVIEEKEEQEKEEKEENKEGERKERRKKVEGNKEENHKLEKSREIQDSYHSRSEKQSSMPDICLLFESNRRLVADLLTESPPSYPSPLLSTPSSPTRGPDSPRPSDAPSPVLFGRSDVVMIPAFGLATLGSIPDSISHISHISHNRHNITNDDCKAKNDPSIPPSSTHLDFAFTMCNPPFFEKLEDAGKNAKTCFGGSSSEMACLGGELRFVRTMIEESQRLKGRVMWFTSMVGKKETLKKIRRDLQKCNVAAIRTTDLIQGRTKRWAIAWSWIVDPKTNAMPLRRSHGSGKEGVKEEEGNEEEEKEGNEKEGEKEGKKENL
eukprot:CAMPEP_0175079366 /NCGR_PEP_ID=MMETSP0052_2-20121109/24775_1 /TAXON_ID=51329 ORGANISM="Polytomella parva, Strain SAG 63-3" /NCGR_SAMPLE_ID=MMETSP0052_2 /ASSEMBLY_ACC=CAM_ASM_000194 /LENGTH=651 /DNA_ID=CAMNT_0016349673 /DNA_START=86 /DNA_END=2041 /DNA_ORIENTATION=-